MIRIPMPRRAMIGSESGETAAGAAAERLERRGPDGRAWLLHERAVVLAVAVLESLQQHLRGFDEALARFLHRHAEAVELHLAGTAAEAEDQPAVGDVVEHRDFL